MPTCGITSPSPMLALLGRARSRIERRPLDHQPFLLDLPEFGYLSFFGAYPFHVHSMACGRNCCWALPMPWPCPRQNRYWYS